MYCTITYTSLMNVEYDIISDEERKRASRFTDYGTGDGEVIE
jgi:hypothetical protein